MALSQGKITTTSLTKLPAAVSNLNMYRALQSEICNCTDQVGWLLFYSVVNALKYFKNRLCFSKVLILYNLF